MPKYKVISRDHRATILDSYEELDRVVKLFAVPVGALFSEEIAIDDEYLTLVTDDLEIDGMDVYKMWRFQSDINYLDAPYATISEDGDLIEVTDVDALKDALEDMYNGDEEDDE